VNIAALTLAQAIAAVLLDLSTTGRALLFGVASAVVSPLPHLVSAVWAWRRAPEGRRLAS